MFRDFLHQGPVYRVRMYLSQFCYMRVLICVLSADERGRVISHVHRARHPQQIHGKNYVQGTRLDRFVECILSARKCGLAVRQAMQQAMQKCDDMYSRLPTVLTDDRFGSGVGVCAVCLNMGTLTTANLGACRAVLLLTSQMLSGQLAGHASWPHIQNMLYGAFVTKSKRGNP